MQRRRPKKQFALDGDELDELLNEVMGGGVDDGLDRLAKKGFALGSDELDQLVNEAMGGAGLGETLTGRCRKPSPSRSSRDREALDSVLQLATDYLSSDPRSSLFNLRRFVEIFVKIRYLQRGLDSAQGDRSLLELLDHKDFKSAVPTSVLDKLHVVRQHGNRAVHGDAVDAKQSRRILGLCRELQAWLDCPSLKP